MSAAAPALNTHDVLMPNGRHKGERLTRLPISYLRWMANEPHHSMRDLAGAELTRRGVELPTVEITGHAIDRASLRVRKIWHETRGEDEGLHSWLVRMVHEAMQSGEPQDGAYRHNSMKLVIEPGAEFPVLKTVMPAKERQQ